MKYKVIIFIIYAVSVVGGCSDNDVTWHDVKTAYTDLEHTRSELTSRVKAKNQSQILKQDDDDIRKITEDD